MYGKRDSHTRWFSGNGSPQQKGEEVEPRDVIALMTAILYASPELGDNLASVANTAAKLYIEATRATRDYPVHATPVAPIKASARNK